MFWRLRRVLREIAFFPHCSTGTAPPSNRPANASGPTVAIAVFALAMLAGGAGPTLAGEGRVAAFDWRQWRSLPVQDGGRQKPLDTLAWETFRTISNKSSFSDPQTQQKLDPTALYLTLLFTGQGWDRPASPHGMPSAEGCPGQPAKHQPDAWDREPLLLVDSVPLRTALGLPADQKYISFLDLARATIELPKTGEKEPFPRLGANAPSRQAARIGRVAKEGPGPGRAVLDVPGRPSRAETRSPAGSGQQNAAMGFRGPSDANQLGRQDGCHRRDSQGESRTAKGPGGLSGKCRRGFQRGVGKLPCRAARGRTAVGQLPLGGDHRPGSGLQPLGAVPHRLGLHFAGVAGACC